jgi:LacI family transcriptional regulator
MATLKDIAKMCGVSTATVSYVLNNSQRQVLPATRARVLEAIAEIGYQPNAHARALKGVRTAVIGVVFPHITVPFANVYFGPVLEGVVSVATERRMATMLFTGFTWEETEQSAQRLFNGVCDGFILVAPKYDSQLARDLLKLGVPQVMVGTNPADPRVPSIDADNRAGGKLATEHLLSLGHRQIGIVLGWRAPRPAVPNELEQMSSSLERHNGYLDALQAWGVEPDPGLVAINCDDELSSKREIARVLREHRPTAVFSCNDGGAYRTIEVCREMGLHVPEDVSVIGFDDIAMSASYDPPLTTVRQPISQIGAKAVEILCDQIDGKALDVRRVLMEVQLIERRSTAAL